MEKIVVTFNYDPETKSVSDVKCSVGDVESKKKTSTKKLKDVVVELEENAVINLEPNKLTFNNKAVSEMKLQYEDRVVIKWEKDKDLNKLVPIIGTDISFNEEGSGNKVTKSNTVMYKGKSNTVLAELGNKFSILPYKEGIWKLIPDTEKGTISQPTISIEQVEKQADNTPADLIVDTEDDNTTIDEIEFTL